MSSAYLTVTKKIFSKLEEMKVLKSLHPNIPRPDEPKMHIFSAIMNNKGFTDGNVMDVSAGGFSFDEREFALFKCAIEAAERFCNTSYKASNLLLSTYGNLKKGGLNPKEYNPKVDLEKSVFSWVEGKNLTAGKKAYIPAQLIYFNYRLLKEPFLSQLISTGAAGGTDRDMTVLRGIYEIVERDCFMTVYLSSSPAPKVNMFKLKNNLTPVFKKKLDLILDTAERYNLKIELVDITNDLGIPSYLGILIDKTGLGPSISLGLKSSLNSEVAIMGSLEECFHTRPWMREELTKRQKNKFKIPYKKVHFMLERGLMWLNPSMIKNIGFLLNQPSVNRAVYNQKYPPKSELKEIIKRLGAMGYEIFAVDMTIDELKSTGFKAYKAIIPKLQPIYFQEHKPEIRMERLKSVAGHFGIKKFEVNKIPHPFL